MSCHFDEVYASDASRDQVENATPGENIFYSVQLSESTDFPDRFFDAVTIAQALHWLDFDPFVRELKRVLKPRGVVFAWTYGFFRIDDEIDRVVRTEFFDPISAFWPKANASAWSGYGDIEMPLPALEIPEFALTCEWDLAELVTYLSTWSAASRYIAQNGPGLIDRVGNALAASWGDPDDKRTVDMDFYVRGWRNA